MKINNIIYYIPNILTVLRILITPFIVITFYFEDLVFAHRFSAALFLLASITDFLDGYIARKFNLQSAFGKMLDPIADKILIGSLIIMLVKFRKINEIPCLLILAREFLISGMREFLSSVSVKVAVTQLAKIKTFVQMTAIFILLLGSKGSGIMELDEIGRQILWLASLLTVLTGYYYFKQSYLDIMKFKN